MARPTRRTWQPGIDEAWQVLKNGAPRPMKMGSDKRKKLIKSFFSDCHGWPTRAGISWRMPSGQPAGQVTSPGTPCIVRCITAI
jgi:hypothetical protein